MKRLFCTSDGKFNPVFFWISILMLCVVAMLVRVIIQGNLSAVMVGTVLGFVITWLTSYDYNKRKKNDNNNE